MITQIEYQISKNNANIFSAKQFRSKLTNYLKTIMVLSTKKKKLNKKTYSKKRNKR